MRSENLNWDRLREDMIDTIITVQVALIPDREPSHLWEKRVNTLVSMCW